MNTILGSRYQFKLEARSIHNCAHKHRCEDMYVYRQQGTQAYVAPSQKHSYEGYLGTSGVCRNYKDLGDHWIPIFVV